MGAGKGEEGGAGGLVIQRKTAQGASEPAHPDSRSRATDSGQTRQEHDSTPLSGPLHPLCGPIHSVRHTAQPEARRPNDKAGSTAFRYRQRKGLMSQDVQPEGVHRFDVGFPASGRVDSTSGAFRILPPFHPSPGALDLVCRRTKTGPGFEAEDYSFEVRLPAGVPAVGVHHHRAQHDDGFTWGRPGAGTNDLALSVLAAYFPVADAAAAPIALAPGEAVSATAHRHHLPFAVEFLLPMPSCGGVVEEPEIRAWVQLQDAIALIDPDPPDVDGPAGDGGADSTGQTGP